MRRNVRCWLLLVVVVMYGCSFAPGGGSSASAPPPTTRAANNPAGQPPSTRPPSSLPPSSLPLVPSPTSPRPAGASATSEPASTAAAGATPTTVSSAPPTAVPSVQPVPGNDGAPHPEEIVYLRSGAVWKVPVQSGPPVRLAVGNNASPQWSPGAYSVAFIRLSSGGVGDLMLVDGAGGAPQLLARTRIVQYAWSPDGEYIAYTRMADSNKDGRFSIGIDWAQIHLLQVSNRKDTVLAPGFDPSFSPDGTQLLFSTAGTLVSGYRERNELRLMDLRTKQSRTVVRTTDIPKDLTQYGAPFGSATTLLRYGAVSPDGKTVAFSAWGGTGVLGTVAVSGGRVDVQDIIVESNFGVVRWQPGGTRIAYDVPTPAGVNQVTILDIATGNRATLGDLQSGTGYEQPAWRPGGASVAIVRSGDKPALVVSDAAGKRIRQLLAGRFSEPNWNPSLGAGGGGGTR